MKSPMAGNTSAVFSPGFRKGCPCMASCCSEECSAITGASSMVASKGVRTSAQAVNAAKAP